MQGTNVNYKNWALGQPGLFGGSEDCALLEKNGHWGDYPCSGIFLLRQNHGWICKYGMRKISFINVTCFKKNIAEYKLFVDICW
jgi:hypothetical protein